MEKHYRDVFKKFQKEQDVCIQSNILGYNKLWFRFLHKDKTKPKGDITVVMGNSIFCTEIGTISPFAFKIIFDNIPFILCDTSLDWYDEQIKCYKDGIARLQVEKKKWAEHLAKKK